MIRSRIPNPPAILALIFLTLPLAGCVAKSEFENVRSQLANCEDEKTALEAQVGDWEARFDRESGRWQEMGDSITEALPRALAEFHTERDRILEIVPQQVQSEVAAYLEDYFATVSQGFRLLKDDNDQIKTQLDATRKALEIVGSDTRSISSAIDEALADERAKRQDEQLRRRQVARRLARLVDTLVEFDRNRIDCKGCKDRLTLSRKERQTILAFHDQLTQEITAIQTFSAAASGASPVAAEEPEANESDEKTNEVAGDVLDQGGRAG